VATNSPLGVVGVSLGAADLQRRTHEPHADAGTLHLTGIANSQPLRVGLHSPRGQFTPPRGRFPPLFAFVSLLLLSFHSICFRFTGFALVSLVLLSFHSFCFRFSAFAFVSLLLLWLQVTLAFFQDSGWYKVRDIEGSADTAKVTIVPTMYYQLGYVLTTQHLKPYNST
jgi:hypothetical protein